MKINIKHFCIMLILLNPLIGLTAAVDIPAGYLSSYSLNSAGTTYNLLGNISANGTAFSVAANNITLDGHGFTIDCGLTDTGHAITSSGKNNLVIKDLYAVQHNSSLSSHVICVRNSANSTIDNVTATAVAGQGFDLSGNNCTVNNCNAKSTSGRSLSIMLNNSNVTNCVSNSTSHYSLGLSNAYNDTFYNCTGYDNSSHCVDLSCSNYNNFTNCTFYSIKSSAIYLDGKSNNNSFNNIYCLSNGTNGAGVYITDSDFNTFNNVTSDSIHKYGWYFNNSSAYNNLVNCTGRSTAANSIYDGIGFGYTSLSFAGTNIYMNFSSQSTLATTNSSKNTINYMCIGDSITAGGKAGLPYGAYVYYANRTLSSKYTFYNVGLGGERADRGKLRFLDCMAVYQPEYVTIMYGANDLTVYRPQQDIIDDIMWMASQAQSRGVTPIIFLTPDRRGMTANTTYLDQNLSRQATDAGYAVFNVYDLIDLVPNNGQYDEYNTTNYVDSVHPTQAANALIGDAFAKYILSNNNPASEPRNKNTAANVEHTPEQKNDINVPAKESKNTPGFAITSGIIAMLAVYLYKKR
jgi:lysophospholipase L1-like esterase